MQIQNLIVNKYNCGYLFKSRLSTEIFLLITAVLVLVLAYEILTKYKGKMEISGLVFVVFGGFLNIFQRVKYSCVRDYINFFNLFAFNFADILIVFGLFLLFIGVLKHGKKNTDNRG